jgi:hypothetical protein
MLDDYIEKMTITVLHQSGRKEIIEIPWVTLQIFTITEKGLKPDVTNVDLKLYSCDKVTRRTEGA